MTQRLRDLIRFDLPYTQSVKLGILMNMQARYIRFVDNRAEMQAYHLMVWRNVTFFVLTTCGLLLVSAPSFMREPIMVQFLRWQFFLTLAVVPFLDILALAWGVGRVRRFQKHSDLYTLVAVSPVNTDDLFNALAEVAWLATWRVTVILVAGRALFAILLVLTVMSFQLIPLGPLVALWSVPFVWQYIWGPLRRGRAMTHFAVKNALIYRRTWQAIVAIILNVISYYLLLALLVGGIAFFVGVTFGVLSPFGMIWPRLAALPFLWAYPFLADELHTELHQRDARDTVIQSNWRHVE